MIKFLIESRVPFQAKYEASKSKYTIKKLSRQEYAEYCKCEHSKMVGRNIVLLSNGRYKSIKLCSNSQSRYSDNYYSSVAELERDINTIKELLNTNLAKNNIEIKEDDESVKNIESLEAFPHKSFKSQLINTTIYKVVGENVNELVFKYDNYDSSTHSNINKTYIMSFKDSDVDIMEAMFKRTLTFPMAHTIIVARGLVNDNKQLYKFFQIPKKDGSKMRDIYEPCPELKECMRTLNLVLQASFDSKQKTNQFAYIKNRNILGNASVHRDNKTIVKTDISSFFESTKYEYVRPYLKFLCRDESLLDEFEKYIVNPKTKGLYMGNPISGTLTNLMMHKVVKHLQNILKKRDMNISVYADDITISTNKKISKEMVTNIVNYALNFYGLDFELKPEKTQKLRNQNRHICGVTINHNDELTVRRNDYEMARVMLYKLSKGEDISIPLNTLKGRLTFYKYIDETGKFNKLFNKYGDVLNRIGFNFETEEIMNKEIM